MNAITCQNLSRSYGDVHALKPLDLEVPAGSIFGWLGRNGAGKTTTIRLLTGLAHPTTGRSWIDGVETTGAQGHAHAKFGYLPQEPAFYTWMTPRESLDYVGQLFGIDARERKRRTDELVTLVGLEKAAGRRIGGFSGGMRQRLGLAQALFHRPPVLILDEPMAGMDPAGRRHVIHLLGSLRGETTVFLSSHILADIERVCDVIGIIHEGQLLHVSSRDDLLGSYAQNVVELELDGPGSLLPSAFLLDLRAQPWVNDVANGKNILRILVNDVNQAKANLLPLALRHELPLARYEWVRPSLEDVFLAISSDQGSVNSNQ